MTNLPPPWVIREIERMRRERELNRRPSLEVPLPERREAPEPNDDTPRGVIVIEVL